MVDRILAENNLPPDIRYLPFVESSYNPAAHSKAGAAGLWQIMPATARSLGLELNATQDERLEPEAATRAAAKYLVDATRRLLKVSRSKNASIQPELVNPFVITSYNYGVNGMRRAINRIGPDYMQVLNRYKSPSFQVAVEKLLCQFPGGPARGEKRRSIFSGCPARIDGEHHHGGFTTRHLHGANQGGFRPLGVRTQTAESSVDPVCLERLATDPGGLSAGTAREEKRVEQRDREAAIPGTGKGCAGRRYLYGTSR